ncbi:MAG: DNA gyrase/topoisomerase IV subunit A [Acidobacteriota bacterium]
MDDKNENGNGFSESEKLHHIKDIPELYRSWFLDYASYVILERAIPEVMDGFKPVHRRILHTMKRLEDGRYNKVANIIGSTMQYHPHGDASIGDALVSLGQKELLIDTQGNWGNTITGDKAAAPRYIEARLSKFALEVVFNPKTTEWTNSYDGRNKEPVVLPVKFPILLFLGAEGIAVGLASKILPHNFNELIDASISYLKGEEFSIYPDFPSGGLADFSKYNYGLQGGKVKVRAKIEKIDKKLIKIVEIPYGKTSTSLIESILHANDKGKIKIKKIDDNTAENVEIVISLPSGTSPDKTIDALYAFTDCEVSISPNCCVIVDKYPKFIGVDEILKVSADNTLNLLNLELEIRKRELEDSWHFSSLEKIFIENRIYINIEECETWESIIETIDEGLAPFKPLLKRDVTTEDIIKLTEIKIKRISKYDSFKADELLRSIEDELDQIKNYLKDIKGYTIRFFQNLKEKYGKDKGRRTEIRNFGQIEATKVVAANRKLYVNRKEGFFGYSLKGDEFVSECSDIDDVIIFLEDGKYMVKKIEDKSFAGKDIIHIAVYKRNDKRTIFNSIYRDGKDGNVMMKRFSVTAVTRDKEYDITKGTPDSKVIYFTCNPNGEAETVKIYLKPKKRLRNLQFDLDFSTLAIKGRNSIGNILSRHTVSKIVLKETGVSTLGDRKIWYDPSVNRLNSEGRGKYLGEFAGSDRIVEIYGSGVFKTGNFDLSNYFESDLLFISKFDPEFVLSIIFFDGEQEYYYLKRFKAEDIEKKTSFIGDNKNSKMVLFSSEVYPEFKINYGGKNRKKGMEIINASEFIAVKSYKARGKRVSTLEIESFEAVGEKTGSDSDRESVPEDTTSGPESSSKPENLSPASEPDEIKEEENKDNKDYSQKTLFSEKND